MRRDEANRTEDLASVGKPTGRHSQISLPLFYFIGNIDQAQRPQGGARDAHCASPATIAQLHSAATSYMRDIRFPYHLTIDDTKSMSEALSTSTHDCGNLIAS
jgi:hypothetical protein